MNYLTIVTVNPAVLALICSLKVLCRYQYSTSWKIHYMNEEISIFLIVVPSLRAIMKKINGINK